MSHRFTFSLAHLSLLVMLSSILCVWLPTAAEWNRQSRMDLPGWYLPEISDDGTLFFSNNPDRGFAVFETETGKCLIAEALKSNGEPKGLAEAFFDPSSKCVYAPVRSTTPIIRYDCLTGARRTFVSPDAPSPAYRFQPPFCEHEGLMIDAGSWNSDSATAGDDYRKHEDVLRCWEVDSGKVRFVTKILWSSHPFFSPVVSGSKLLFINPAVRDVNATSDGNGTVVQCHDLKTGHMIWRTSIERFMGQMSNRLYVSDNDLVTLITESVNGPTRQSRVTQLRLDDGSILDTDVPIPGISDTYAVTRDGKQLFALVHDPSKQTRRLWKIDIAPNGSAEMFDADTTWINDLKLINEDRQLAIASRDGMFQVLDAATGKEVFHRTGLRYAPSRTIWFVLGGLGTAWCILWWRATRARKDQAADWGRYAGLMVFVCGFTVGLMILGYRDPHQRLHFPTAAAAATFAGLAAVIGLIFLFLRQCNKLASGYALVASIGIACYLIWLARQSS